VTTVKQVVDTARLLLQDAEKERYKDDELVALVNMGLMDLRHKRPEAFIGLYHVETPTVALNDPFPVSDMYLGGMVKYVAGYAEVRDDDYTADGRATMLVSTAMKDWGVAE
jgi:hypothetical protein